MEDSEQFTMVSNLIIKALQQGKGKADWYAIRTMIINSGYRPTNWRTDVRGPLQMLLRRKVIERTEDMDHEVYTKAAWYSRYYSD